MGEKKAKKSQDNLVFTEFKAKEFLKKYADMPKNVLLDPKEVKKTLLEKKLPSSITLPVVLKISSDFIVHKTEENAVKMVCHEIDFFKTLADFEKRLSKYKARGVIVEEYVKGQELIIGIKKDKTFGHVIGLGLGGIFTETIRDISFRACPICSDEFNSMVSDLKFKNLISGTRGKKNDVEELKKIVIEISKIPDKYPKILELDINPIILNEHYCKLVDARIVFEK